ARFPRRAGGREAGGRTGAGHRVRLDLPPAEAERIGSRAGFGPSGLAAAGPATVLGSEPVSGAGEARRPQRLAHGVVPPADSHRLGLPLAAEGGAAGRADTGVEVSSAESFNRGPTCPPPGSASDANESGRSHSCCARGGARSMPERVHRLGLV